MKIRYYLILLFLTIYFNSSSQCNLVPNPDFENYTDCPTSIDQLNRASPWTRITGTADYFNRCANGTQGNGNLVGVPNASAGFQQPHSGDGYAGVIAYYFPNDPAVKELKEHIKIELTTPLEIGETYLVEFWCSLGDNSRYGVDGLGALFSNGTENVVTIGGGNAIRYISDTPQIISTSGIPLINKTDWVLVSGSFIADQAYSHLTIGGFYLSDNTTAADLLPNAPSWNNFAYYYIDDVSVKRIYSDLPDTTLCSDDVITLNVTDNNVTYKWQDNSTNSNYTVSQPGIYWVEKTNPTNNCIDIDTINVQYQYPPSVNLGTNGILCDNQSVTLDASCEGCTYQWHDGSTTANYNTSVDQNTYWVTVTNKCGSLTESIKIDFQDCESLLYVPKAFTPNNDGLNDMFYIASPTKLKSFTITLFNRWGQPIFNSSDQDFSWNGLYNGNYIPQGVYIWKIDYVSEAENPKQLVGTITAVY